MEEDLKVFCTVHQKLELLNTEKGRNTTDLRNNKKTSINVLKELAKAFSEEHTTNHFLVSIGNDSYKIDYRPGRQISPSTTSEIAATIIDLWSASGDELSRIHREPCFNLVKELANEIEEKTIGQLPKLVRPHSVNISKFVAKNNVDPPKQAPGSWNPLVTTIIDANTKLKDLQMQFNDCKKTLKEQQSSIEGKLVPSLQAMPAGSVTQVNLRTDEDSVAETYYVRVKNQKKIQKKKISAGFYRKILLEAIESAISQIGVDEDFGDMRIGELIANDLKAKMIQRETCVNVPTGYRVSLDKVRKKMG